jgi:hypothetical protein
VGVNGCGVKVCVAVGGRFVCVGVMLGGAGVKVCVSVGGSGVSVGVYVGPS